MGHECETEENRTEGDEDERPPPAIGSAHGGGDSAGDERPDHVPEGAAEGLDGKHAGPGTERVLVADDAWRQWDGGRRTKTGTTAGDGHLKGVGDEAGEGGEASPQHAGATYHTGASETVAEPGHRKGGEDEDHASEAGQARQHGVVDLQGPLDVRAEDLDRHLVRRLEDEQKGEQCHDEHAARPHGLSDAQLLADAGKEVVGKHQVGGVVRLLAALLLLHDLRGERGRPGPLPVVMGGAAGSPTSPASWYEPGPPGSRKRHRSVPGRGPLHFLSGSLCRCKDERYRKGGGFP